MTATSKKYNLKERILTILKQSHTPYSVKDFQDNLHYQYNKTSIYRQLERLFETGKVHKIETGKETFFELSNHKHAHFQCIKCGLIECILLSKNFNVNLKELEQFQILDISLDIKGVCEKCNILNAELKVSV